MKKFIFLLCLLFIGCGEQAREYEIKFTTPCPSGSKLYPVSSALFKDCQTYYYYDGTLKLVDSVGKIHHYKVDYFEVEETTE